MGTEKIILLQSVIVFYFLSNLCISPISLFDVCLKFTYSFIVCQKLIGRKFLIKLILEAKNRVGSHTNMIDFNCLKILFSELFGLENLEVSNCENL